MVVGFNLAEEIYDSMSYNDLVTLLKANKEPSEALQLAAVQQNGYAIRYISEPTEAVKLAAVGQDGYAIKYIKKPSEALQLAAVTQNGDAIRYISEPTEAVKKAAKKKKIKGVLYMALITEEKQGFIKLGITLSELSRLRQALDQLRDAMTKVGGIFIGEIKFEHLFDQDTKTHNWLFIIECPANFIKFNFPVEDHEEAYDGICNMALGMMLFKQYVDNAVKLGTMDKAVETILGWKPYDAYYPQSCIRAKQRERALQITGEKNE